MAEQATKAATEVEITDDDIHRRVYEISLGSDASTEEENWIRAVHELRGGPATAPKPRARKSASAGNGSP